MELVEIKNSIYKKTADKTAKIDIIEQIEKYPLEQVIIYTKGTNQMIIEFHQNNEQIKQVITFSENSTHNAKETINMTNDERLVENTIYTEELISHIITKEKGLEEISEEELIFGRKTNKLMKKITTANETLSAIVKVDEENINLALLKKVIIEKEKFNVTPNIKKSSEQQSSEALKTYK